MEKFIKFLKDNNAWGNFERNFIKQERDVERYKKDCKTLKNSYLSYAFIWSKTREGPEYWSELNRKWKGGNTQLKEKLLSDD